MTTRLQDLYDAGYMRKKRELDSFKNWVPWVMLAPLILGLIMLAVFASTAPSDSDRTYVSPDDQEIVLSANRDYVIHDDELFIRPVVDAEVKAARGYAIGCTFGLIVTVTGAMALIFYVLGYIPDRCQAAGWELVKQQTERKEV